MDVLKGKRVAWMKYDGYKKPRVKVEAVFLRFGCSHEAYNEGVGNLTTSIIMLEDGSINSIPAEDTRFDSDVYKLIAEPDKEG